MSFCFDDKDWVGGGCNVSPMGGMGGIPIPFFACKQECVSWKYLRRLRFWYNMVWEGRYMAADGPLISKQRYPFGQAREPGNPLWIKRAGSIDGPCSGFYDSSYDACWGRMEELEKNAKINGFISLRLTPNGSLDSASFVITGGDILGRLEKTRTACNSGTCGGCTNIAQYEYDATKNRGMGQWAAVFKDPCNGCSAFQLSPVCDTRKEDIVYQSQVVDVLEDHYNLGAFDACPINRHWQPLYNPASPSVLAGHPGICNIVLEWRSNAGLSHFNKAIEHFRVKTKCALQSDTYVTQETLCCGKTAKAFWTEEWDPMDQGTSVLKCDEDQKLGPIKVRRRIKHIDLHYGFDGHVTQPIKASQLNYMWDTIRTLDLTVRACQYLSAEQCADGWHTACAQCSWKNKVTGYQQRLGFDTLRKRGKTVNTPSSFDDIVINTGLVVSGFSHPEGKCDTGQLADLPATGQLICSNQFNELLGALIELWSNNGYLGPFKNARTEDTLYAYCRAGCCGVYQGLSGCGTSLVMQNAICNRCQNHPYISNGKWYGPPNFTKGVGVKQADGCGCMSYCAIINPFKGSQWCNAQPAGFYVESYNTYARVTTCSELGLPADCFCPNHYFWGGQYSCGPKCEAKFGDPSPAPGEGAQYRQTKDRVYTVPDPYIINPNTQTAQGTWTDPVVTKPGGIDLPAVPCKWAKNHLGQEYTPVMLGDPSASQYSIHGVDQNKTASYLPFTIIKEEENGTKTISIDHSFFDSPVKIQKLKDHLDNDKQSNSNYQGPDTTNIFNLHNENIALIEKANKKLQIPYWLKGVDLNYYNKRVILDERYQIPIPIEEVQYQINKDNLDTQDDKIQKTNYPTVFNMAKNLGKSMIGWAKSGFETLSDDSEEFKKRLETCKSCKEWDSQALGGTGRCRLCGCSTQAKLRLASESCPINLWGPVNKT